MSTTEIRQLRSRIGKAVRKLREAEGISAQYLAKVIGVTQPTISRIESGATSISAENLCFLAKSFNRPLSFFIGEQNPITYDETDIIRAGLVHYGASHLKAKKTIDVNNHYRTFEALLNDSLYEIDDPRIAAALATTIYNQAREGKINALKIVSQIKNKQLAKRLYSLLLLLEKALTSTKKPSRVKNRAHRQIETILSELKERYTTISTTDIGVKGPNDIANFIEESLSNE